VQLSSILVQSAVAQLLHILFAQAADIIKAVRWSQLTNFSRHSIPVFLHKVTSNRVTLFVLGVAHFRPMFLE
jgi:hypothetical protein